jgi:hypothetical protein
MTVCPKNTRERKKINMTWNVYNKKKSQWVSSGAIKSNRKVFFKKKYFERGHWQSKIFYIDGDWQDVQEKYV